jgi:hypothetical protein
MNRFLIKLVTYLLLFGVCFCLYFGIKFSLIRGEKLIFVSNSVSFNAKARFLAEKDFSKTRCFILGSSLSLHNIDGVRLEQLNKVSVLNLSSWGRKLVDFESFLPMIPDTAVLIMNIGFTDFGTSSMQHYEGYPMENTHHWKNVLLNLRTYDAQLAKIKEYTNSEACKTYNDLNFDKTGTILLDGTKVEISKIRWEHSPSVPSEEDIWVFINELAKLGNRKVFIFFSPERISHKSENKRIAIDSIKRKIESQYPNVSFFNNYALNFDEPMFVDCTHFSKKGAEKYTEIITEQMRNSQIAPFGIQRK